MVSATFATISILICMIITPFDESIAKYTGIIVSSSITIVYSLQDFIMSINRAESEMSAVERVLEYQEL